MSTVRCSARQGRSLHSARIPKGAPMSGPLVPDDERPATAGGPGPGDLVPDEERPVPDDAAGGGDQPGALPDAERPVPGDDDAAEG